MIYAHIFYTVLQARNEALKFTRSNKDRIVRVRAALMPIEIVLASGDRHHFLTLYEYELWNLGREYVINGHLYRSGIRIQGEEKDNAPQD